MRPFQLQLCPDGVHLLGFFLEIVFLSFLSFTILMVLFLFLMLVVDVFRLIFFSFFVFIVLPRVSRSQAPTKKANSCEIILFFLFGAFENIRWMNSLPEMVNISIIIKNELKLKIAERWNAERDRWWISNSNSPLSQLPYQLLEGAQGNQISMLLDDEHRGNFHKVKAQNINHDLSAFGFYVPANFDVPSPIRTGRRAKRWKITREKLRCLINNQLKLAPQTRRLSEAGKKDDSRFRRFQLFK